MLLTQVHLKARRDASKKRPDSITPRESLTLMVLITAEDMGGMGATTHIRHYLSTCGADQPLLGLYGG